MQMRDRRMVGRLAVSDCRISTDLLRSMSFSQARMASIRGWAPTMAITRFRL